MLDPDISTTAALRHLSRPDADDPLSIDRRRFLQLVGMGFGAGLVAGPGTSLLDHALGHDPSAWALGPVGPSDGILVVIGMYGGNDGQNTVVPITDGRYYDQRSRLSIAPEDTQSLDARSGLNPHLTELKRFWDAGQLAIVEGVGHTRADFSHFSSMAYWMAGRTAGETTSGWVGRWLDGYLGGARDVFAAAEIGTSLPLQMIGDVSAATAVPTGQPDFGVRRNAADDSLHDAIRSWDDGSWGASWGGGIARAQVDQLDVAAGVVSEIPSDLSQSEIVAKLEVAARLINANLGFRVLNAGWHDFDSHAGQPAMHTARMRELNEGLQRFFSILHPDWGSRVTVITFSEFGRTPYDNDGMGTDHGSSAPQFVFGANVKGGRYGQRPSLAGLDRWDRMPTHVRHVDYFGSVIDGWLGGGGTEVLGPFENLGLFRSGPAAAPSFPGVVLGEYVPVVPVRIYDSRNGIGGRSTRIGPGETVKVKVAGAFGVPTDDVRALAANVTSVRPTERTYVTGFPTGFTRPFTSSLNPDPGLITPNMAVVGVGADGTFSLSNEFGTTDLLVDLAGFYRGAGTSKMKPLAPVRLLDTRKGVGAPEGPARGGEPIALQIAGRGGVPSSGVDAVVLNVVAARPTVDGWVTAWPTGAAKPVVSNVSFRAGEVIPNMIMCKVGADGKINLEANEGEVHLIADVVGCYTDAGTALSPIVPYRLLDTRHGVGAPAVALGPGEELALDVAGRGGVHELAGAAVINLTGIRASEQTYLTVYPDGTDRPLASSLNPPPGRIVGNLIVAKLGDEGRVRIFNERGTVHVTADATGFFV